MIDFWFILSDGLFVSSLNVSTETIALPGAIPATTEVTSEGVEGLIDQFGFAFEKPPGFTLTNGYTTKSYSEAVPIRDNLQDIEDDLYPNFIVAGCWDFYTGEPVGGVGSPWFLSPPELLDFMPNGVYEDRFFRMGQHKRAFIT